MCRLLPVLLFPLAPGACEAAVEVAGRPTVIDGDSLEIGATSIRIFGIDAPEAQQTCTRGGAPWRCGDEATRKLEDLIGRARVTCTQRDIDDYDRVVAVCRRGNTDLGAQMVSAGLALAYRQYGRDYVDEETQARTARRGLWAGEFTRPWEWRRNPAAPESESAAGRAPATRTEPRAPAEPSTSPNARCRIKGNINGDGERIYHSPDSPAYATTRIDEQRGERWFCSAAEARRAGWRAPRG